MIISKKLLFITILNIPIVFNIFTQSNLETIENYVSTLHAQHQSTTQNKIARWLNNKLNILCQYYEDEKAMALQRAFNDSRYNYPTALEPICIRDCSNTKLTDYNKEEEVAALAFVIQNYPNTKEAILKALISDEKAEQIALDAKVEFYNAQQQENHITDILNTDTRPRWLKNKLIQYITSPLSEDETTARFIDH